VFLPTTAPTTVSGSVTTAHSAVRATMVPAGLAADGLPVGAQLIGALGADLDLLAVARLMEREGFGFRAPPGFD
jgi:Asp-tRNA(Asn)/Glu-tRNA(Gln) amidotransferase A subunit family amidase